MSALCACSSSSTPPPQRSDSRESSAAARAQQAEAERRSLELEQQLAVVEDENEALRRDRQRVTRELEAAHDRREADRQSLDAALTLLEERETQRRTFEQRVAELEGQLAQVEVPSPPEGEVEGAIALLRQKDAELAALREEVVRLRAGERDEPPAELEQLIQLVRLDLDQPVALVDGLPLTRRQFVEFLYHDLGTPAALDQFLNRFLVAREAKSHGVEVSDVDVEVWVREQVLNQLRQAGTEESLQARLRELGFVYEDPRAVWEAWLRYQARPNLQLEALVELGRETPEGQARFEARIQAEYERRYSERVTASHILVRLPEDAAPSEEEAARAKAEALYEQVRRGVPYAEVARRYSEDPDSGRLGGQLGSFDRTRFATLPELNRAFFALPVGEASRPVRSQVGFHVVMVENRQPPSRAFDAQTRRELARELQDEPASEVERQALIQRLRERSEIQKAVLFDGDE